MCGIAGIVSRDGRAVIEPMTEALRHRGPDGFGYFIDDRVALGHRRLSIIDVQGGKQPIVNESGNLHLICNGEIYNSPELRDELISRGHRFRSATDVEVIVHLYEEYGEKCVQHLRGMFAFAIWDSQARTLFMARDHLGQKPLFYFHDGNNFLFASEIKSILASGLCQPSLDVEGLWHYASLRFMPDRYTLFRGVRKLPAATTLTFSEGRIASKRYWHLDFTQKFKGRESDIEEQLHAELYKTVGMHLLSDVRVGSFLSGGIDSTTIASMMAEWVDDPVPCFSIGVEEQGLNELPYSRMVATARGLEPHERVARADIVNLLPKMVFHMDEPADPYGVGIYLVSALAGESVKVVLSGDGADESFAGYDRYAGQRIVDYYCLLPHWFRRRIMGPLIGAIPESYNYKSIAQKAAWMHEMSFFSGAGRYAQSMSFLRFTDKAKSCLFTQQARASLTDDDSIHKILVHYDAPNASDAVDKMLYTDLMTRIPDHNLVIGDRMSMAHSLEVRAPFVDHRLVEFAASIPARMKLSHGRLKHILRNVSARYLPAELVRRRKQGFGFPLGMWLKTDLADFLVRLFEESRMVQTNVFDRDYLETILREHLSGKADHNYRIWLLINMELWHRLYIEGATLDNLQAEMAAMARRE